MYQVIQKIHIRMYAKYTIIYTIKDQNLENAQNGQKLTSFILR